MILKNFFQQTLNWCFSYIRSTEKKIRKIRSLKVYSNLINIKNANYHKNNSITKIKIKTSLDYHGNKQVNLKC